MPRRGQGFPASPQGVDPWSFLTIQVHGSFLFIRLGFVSDYSLHLSLLSMAVFVWFIAQEFCCSACSFVGVKTGLFIISPKGKLHNISQSM